MTTKISIPANRTLLAALLLFVCCCTAAPVRAARRPIAKPQTATPKAPQDAQAPVDKEITIFGAKIHYVEAGSGPTLILLHGLGGNWQNWALNIGPLTAKFHVFVPDQIGFGASDKPLINYRAGTYVDFLDQFCKQLKIEHTSLMGLSMGGWVAAAYTVAYPNKVDRLVLVDAAGYRPANVDPNALYDLNPSTREAMKRLSKAVFYNQQIYGSDMAIDVALTWRINAGDGFTIKSIIESVIRGEDFLDGRVKAIKQPTLIVWGRQDGLVPLADAERFKKEIPNSTLVVIEQCGHVPNVEKAAEFNPIALKFLAP